ncbi:MAG: dihydroneopterin aldolase [Rhodospirillales bacterium]|nr:dihydroneopterin aldolase [Rhodospirillales bacterium]
MSPSQVKLVKPDSIADARAKLRHVFIRDLVLSCSIGVHRHEKDAVQRVRINLDLAVREGDLELEDKLGNVLCYEEIGDGVREIVGRDHVNLVETLAEEISSMCLEDSRVRSARVRVEKLDIMADATSVGVEIERFNTKV